MQMLLKEIHDLLVKTANMIIGIPEEHFHTRLALLSGQSICDQVLLIINRFLALDKGYEDAVISYNDDLEHTYIFKDRKTAQHRLIYCYNTLLKPDKKLMLSDRQSQQSEYELDTIFSTYYRELDFLLTYTGYRVNLIKFGIDEIKGNWVQCGVRAF
jgi:hypothetical protein